MFFIESKDLNGRVRSFYCPEQGVKRLKTLASKKEKEIFKMFGAKKLTLDDILKGIENLSDTDKAKVKENLKDLYKAEDEREIDKIEEEKSDNAETADEKKEEVAEESEEIGKDVDETEEEAETDEAEEKAKDTEEPEKEIENAETSKEEMPAWAKAITDRLDRVEKYFAGKEESVDETAKEIYGLGNGVFQGEDKAGEEKQLTPAELKKILDRIKR